MKDYLKTFAAATNNELFDADYNGGEWMVDAEETHESLDDWIDSSSKWNERSAMRSGEIAGFRFLSWSKVQLFKGSSRAARSVIDFGDVRYALACDLMDY